MGPRIRKLLVALALLVPAMALAEPPPPLAPEEVERWLATLRPKAEEEAWREIGWRPTLWQAVRDAHREHKPVLLWAMNGHPLGCT